MIHIGQAGRLARCKAAGKHPPPTANRHQPRTRPEPLPALPLKYRQTSAGADSLNCSFHRFGRESSGKGPTCKCCGKTSLNAPQNRPERVEPPAAAKLRCFTARAVRSNALNDTGENPLKRGGESPTEDRDAVLTRARKIVLGFFENPERRKPRQRGCVSDSATWGYREISRCRNQEQGEFSEHARPDRGRVDRIALCAYVSREVTAGGERVAVEAESFPDEERQTYQNRYHSVPKPRRQDSRLCARYLDYDATANGRRAVLVEE